MICMILWDVNSEESRFIMFAHDEIYFENSKNEVKGITADTKLKKIFEKVSDTQANYY